MSPDDTSLLLAVFRAARSSRSRWTRDPIGPCGREPGTRYWTCDRDSSIGLDIHGHLTTAISGVDCHSVEDAVNHLVDVGILPVELHSIHRALTAGAVTEWGIRCTCADHVMAGQVYLSREDEEFLRRYSATSAHGELVSRQVGPWTAVADV